MPMNPMNQQTKKQMADRAPIIINYQPPLHIHANTSGVSRTKQQFKEECDVNNILKKYRATGLLTHIRATKPQYGDFTQVTDFQSAMDQVQRAQDAFLKLPAKVRSRFRNDPSELVEFLSNPANTEEAIQLGLAERKATGGTTKPLLDTSKDVDAKETTSDALKK